VHEAKERKEFDEAIRGSYIIKEGGLREEGTDAGGVKVGYRRCLRTSSKLEQPVRFPLSAVCRILSHTFG